MNNNFKIGDMVIAGDSPMNTKENIGIIFNIEQNNLRPIQVIFNNNDIFSYTNSGRCFGRITTVYNIRKINHDIF